MSQKTNQPPQPTTSLKRFEILVGEWDMVGTHPMLPSAVYGRATFEWLREGALLVSRSDWQPEGGVPSGYSVIGHDDTVETTCTVLYTDVRGVARIYQMSLEGSIWKMWRNSPDFSQRMTGTFSEDGNTIRVQGELSRDGSTWEGDLNVTYTRRK